MKTIRLIRESLLFVAALTLVACASEDTQQKDETKQPETKYVATFTGHQPKVTAPAKSRTTATYTIGNPAQVLWEATDKIWVKADDGNFYQSDAANFAASATPTDHSRAKFSLTTGSYMKLNPEVRYTGANTDANTVVIASTQSQGAPNNFSHLGTAGDCGAAFAQGGGNDHEFTLRHKASYLCFLPRCMNTQLGPNIKLTKITVTADKDIAGTYDFSNGSLMGKTPTGGSKSITLTLDGGNGFTLNTTTANLSMNGAYMVIAPGTYNLTISYTLKDVNGVSGDITKELNGFTCPEGDIRDITANLTPPPTPNIPAPKYYMWDAKQDYWYGHLKPDGTPDGNYPQNNSDPRWYHEGHSLAVYQNMFSCKNCPNINEMIWYALKGDAREGGLAVDNGHLKIIKGIWLKKKAKIMADEQISEAQMKNGYPKENPYNWAIPGPAFLHTSFTARKVSVPNTTDYFFLPEPQGYYYMGWLYTSQSGGYWTSQKNDLFRLQEYAYCLIFGAYDGVYNGVIEESWPCERAMYARAFE